MNQTQDNFVVNTPQQGVFIIYNGKSFLGEEKQNHLRFND